MQSVKADLAMYSHTVGVSRQCMSVSLILGCKLDFSSALLGSVFANPVTYVDLITACSCYKTYQQTSSKHCTGQ